MKLTKRIFALALAVLMCLSSFIACNSNDNGNNGGGNDEPTPTPTSDLAIVEDGKTQYTIIYSSKGANWEGPFARKLATVIQNATGTKITVKKDTEVTLADDAKEIVVGTATNNRSSLYTSDGSYNLGYNSYVKGSRFIIEAGSKTGAYFAMYQLFADQFDIDLQKDYNSAKKVDADALKISADYNRQKTLASTEFPYLGIPAEDFLISRTAEYVGTCLATDLRTKLKNYVGAEIEVRRLSTFKDDKGYFVFENDDELENGDWDITIDKNKVIISAGSYIGFVSAITKISTYKHTDGYMTIGLDANVEGNFMDNLSVRSQDQTTKYIYNRLGENRVMFYNALWGDPNPDSRNKLQASMIAEYRPDVLGLQEMGSTTKRGENGSGELIALLAELGYVEAVDPRVKNMYATNQAIPGTDDGAVTGSVDTMDKIGGKKFGDTNFYDNEFNREYANRVSGNPIMGYGTGGGSKVTVGGESFYTTFNSTPLLYNPNTTELIHAEYYWYKYQSDMRTYEDCELCQTHGYHTSSTKLPAGYDMSAYDAMHHPNGASDAASKSATWGIFRSKETGEVYIAISTHMCTRSNYVRYLQGREVLALIETIKAAYPQYANAPIFFGGDMNGDADDLNTIVFKGENSPLKSLQDYTDESGKHIATEFTASILTSHGYPEYDEKEFIMTPGNSIVGEATGGKSIDHIYVSNEAAMEVHVYGIVADFCALRSSDHLPLLVDFTIK